MSKFNNILAMCADYESGARVSLAAELFPHIQPRGAPAAAHAPAATLHAPIPDLPRSPAAKPLAHTAPETRFTGDLPPNPNRLDQVARSGEKWKQPAPAKVKFDVQLSESGEPVMRPEWFGDNGKLQVNKADLIKDIRAAQKERIKSLKIDAKRTKAIQSSQNSLNAAIKRSQFFESAKSPKAISGYLALASISALFIALSGGLSAPTSSSPKKTEIVSNVKESLILKTYTIQQIKQSADSLIQVMGSITNQAYADEINKNIAMLTSLSASCEALSQSLSLDDPAQVSQYTASVRKFESSAVSVITGLDKLSGILSANNQDLVINSISELSTMLADVMGVMDSVRTIQKSGAA